MGDQSPPSEDKTPSPEGPRATPRPRKKRMSGILNSSASRDRTRATIRKMVAVKKRTCVEIIDRAPEEKSDGMFGKSVLKR
jgi:BRCT domain type II-containing protein